MSLVIILLLISTARSAVPNFPRDREVSCRPAGEGTATYYGIGDGFAGRKTANGEIYRIDKFTAAHMKLPIGSIVRVKSGEQFVYVRINDRGPAKWTGNVIDLSPVAFSKLGPLKQGVLPVKLEVCENRS